MSFSFGGNTPAFGSTPQKPTGFATPFGSTQTTTTQSTSFGFGQSQPTPAFGSTFGSTTTTAPPAFGAPAAGAAPTFGSTFGAPGANTAPTFGSTFGTPAVSAAPAFGSTFGAPASGAAPAFGSTFGTAQTQGGTSLFGQAQKPGGGLFGTSTTPSSGLFGSTPATQSSLFGSTATPSLFGQPAATTTTPSLFGQSSAVPTFGGGLFGSAPQSTAPSLFGTTTTNTGFGGFGTGGGLFGAKPAQQPGTGFAGQQPAVPQNKNQQVMASVYSINVFNDERDDILKKWNMLQACWGKGKGFYSTSQPPVEYTPQNPFYRFKAMGYNAIPEQDNSEGVVKLVFNKKVTELRNQQDLLKSGIGGVLGNRPNLTVDILLIKAVSDSQTEVKVSVSEKGVTGLSRKIPATELAAYLNQPAQKQQLTNVGVTAITPFVTPTKGELEEYLKTPPPGIDRQMWQAAVQDNPDPKKYIPVAINGFGDLRTRMLNQEYQTGLHAAFLEKVSKEMAGLKTKHSASIAHINELKQKFLELQHRILRVLVKQESNRKVGISLQPEEEALRGRLEVMHAQLNAPKQFKGQINELLSHVKMMDHSSKQSERYRLDADAQEEIKQFLKMQQGGIAQLVEIVNADLQSLKIISGGLNELTDKRHLL